jgi:uncharacterized membrane protein YccC
MMGLATRLVGELGDELSQLSLSGPRTNAAVRTMLSGVLSLLVALWLNLDDPWWAAITGFSLVQQNAAATLLRSVDRALGTIVGALIGYFAVGLVGDHLVFLLICGGCAAFGIYGQERAEHGYAILLGAVTVILVMFGSLVQPEIALHLATYRALAILVGVGVACAVDSILAEPGIIARGAAAKPGVWASPIDRELLVVAVSGGVAIAMVPIIWETLQLPGLGQTPITAFVIMTAMRHEPAWKAATRAFGCLLGGLYGLVAMSWIGDAFLPWLLFLSAGLFVCGHIYRGSGDASYVGQQAGVAIMLAMIQGAAPSSDVVPAIDRMVGVFGGILVVAACHPVLAPVVRRLMGPAPET